MQIQDYHRLSIITKKIAEQREVLCQESVHEQAVTWKGNFYVVNWRLSFDLISNRFNIEVMCLSSFKNENGLFTWPKNVQREDEWPIVLPVEWLKNKENDETQTH